MNRVQLGILVPLTFTALFILAAWTALRLYEKIPADGLSIQPHHLQANGITIPNDGTTLYSDETANDLGQDQTIVQIDALRLSDWKLNLSLLVQTNSNLTHADLAIGKALPYRIRVGESEREISVILQPSTWHLHWTAWFVILLNGFVGLYLMLRIPHEPAAQMFLLLSINCAVAMIFSSLPISGVGIIMSQSTLAIYLGRLFALMMLTALTAHFGFVFPKPHPILLARPWLVALPYVLMPILFISGIMLMRMSIAEELLWVGKWIQAARVVYLVNFAIFFFAIRTGYADVQRATDGQALAIMLLGVNASILLGIGLVVLPGLLLERVLFEQQTATMLAMIPIPIAALLAISRYRLFGIENIISYGVVYLTLTTVVIGLYVLIVSLAIRLLPFEDNLIASFVATGLIIAVIYPIHQIVQRFINRLLYGVRGEPMQVLEAIKIRLSDAATPQETLNNSVRLLADLLKLPYVAIALHLPQKLHVVASQGHLPVTVETIQLIYQSEEIGKLRVAPRASDEPLDELDHQLLEQVATHISAAAYTLRLTDALYKSRTRLVAVREDERRRLQRDLHDGLGPTLASHIIKIGIARSMLRNNPAYAEELLNGLEADMDSALQDIRSLVYALRPPELEQLGLSGAIREHIERLGSTHPHLRITFADGALRQLSPEQPLEAMAAATEVAIYRIVQAGLDNVIKHAQAESCEVQLTLADEYELTITDDGIGIPTGYHAGVGLTSMRERADELSGEFSIQSRLDGGTMIRVCLPRRTGEQLTK